MKKALCGAILLLLAGCIWHRTSPLPDVLAPHNGTWEENVHSMPLPHALPVTEPLEDLPPAYRDDDETAQALVSQYAGPKIDLYFYYMNRWYRQQQAVFILKNRQFFPRHQGGNIYHVTCTARARTGLDLQHTHPLTLPCGVWKVDVGLQIVLPQDPKSETIWAE